jgi:hypothetical protein
MNKKQIIIWGMFALAAFTAIQQIITQLTTQIWNLNPRIMRTGTPWFRTLTQISHWFVIAATIAILVMVLINILGDKQKKSLLIVSLALFGLMLINILVLRMTIPMGGIATNPRPYAAGDQALYTNFRDSAIALATVAGIMLVVNTISTFMGKLKD